MKDPKDLPPDFTDLRRRAEEQLQAEAILPEKLSPDQAARLIHELRVHQIELEMQNDELRRSQALLEESRSKYADLYDFAPVGYLTLDALGAIVEANLTAATLLDVDRSKLLGRFFPNFLVDADRRVFRQLLSNGLNQPERRGEFHLKNGNGGVRVMLLDILFLTDAQGQERRRVSLTDITELKRTQEELRLHKEDLEELVAHRTTELIEANEQLREANDNLAALFQAAPLAIAEFDAAGKVTRINPACERLYGWSLEEVQGRLPLSIPAEAPEESLALLQQLLQGKSVTGTEIKQQRKDGAILDASVSGAPLYDAQGKVRGFVGLAEDITERKKLAEDVRTQARVLANMAEGVVVTDRGGQITYTNPAFDAMFGYEPGQLVGRHSNILNHTPPEENAGLKKDILTSIKTSGSWTGEFRNCRKNGSPFYTSARISTLTVGGKKLYVSVQEDITQQKKAREMLERQAELLDLAHDAILVRDPQGHITYWNQGATNHYGWTREAALGKMSHKLLQTAFPQPLLEIERQLLEQGFWEGELTHTTSQGRQIVMSSRWTAKRDEAGRVIAILEMNQDVTAQKQIEAEVHRLASFPLLNPSPVIEVDEDGKVTYANPAARHLTEKLRFTGGIKAFLPGDLKENFAAVRKGGPRQYAYELTLKDRVYTVVLSFPHDLPTARLYALDITERQRAEAALRKSEQRFRRLVEANVVGIVVSDEEKIVEANDEFLRLVGYSREEMLAGEVKWMEMTPREYIPQDAQALYELKSTGAHTPYEKIFLRQDGSPAPVVVGGALLEEEPLSWVSFVLDISDRKRLEDSLRLSEARFRAIFANASIGIITTDLTGRLQEFNAPVIKGLGYTPMELKDTKFRDLTHPDDLAVDQDLFTELAAGKRDRYQVEKRYIRKDGRTLWGRLHVSLVRRPGGEPDFTVALVEDVTLRKESQAALAESEARYRTLVDLSPDAIMVHARGRYVFVNPAGLKLFGAAASEDLLGRRVMELVHPDSQITVRRRLRAGERLDIREVKILRLDGCMVEVEVAATPITYSGQPAVQVVLRDITERKRAEKALRESEARERARAAELQAILDTTPGAILIAHDPECLMISGNRAAYELLRRAPGSNLSQSTAADDKPANFRVIKDGREVSGEEMPVQRAAASGETTRNYEVAMAFDDGSVRHILGDAVPLLDEAGKPRGAVAAFLDITERRRAEEETQRLLNLVHLEKEKLTALVNSISDEVWFADTQKKFTLANPSALQEFGLDSSEEIDVEKFAASLEVFRTDGSLRPIEESPSLRALKGELIRNLEEIIRTPATGELRYRQVNSSPVRDGSGNLIGSVSVVQDITERKAAEKALRDSREDLNRAQAVAHIGSWRLDVSKSELTWSEETHRIFGIPQGSPLTYEIFLGTVHPEDRDYIDQKWAAAMKGEPYDIEHRIIADGAVKWVRELAELEFNQDGQLLGGFGTVQDITARKRAEAALAESEARYRSLVELSPDAVLVHSGGKYVFANLAAARLFGAATPEEMQGQDVVDLVPPDNRDGVRARIQQVYHGKTSPLVESQVLRLDGRPVDVESTGAPINYEGQAAILLVLRDITARQAAAAALRESQRQAAFLAELLEKSSQPFAIRHLDGGLEFFNPAYQRMLGYTREELEAIHFIPDFTPPAWHEHEEESLQEILRTGEPLRYEKEYLHKDGHRVPAELFVHLRRDDEGIPLYFYAFVTDITARQEAEAALRESEDRFRKIYENAAMGIAITDLQGRFQQVNPSHCAILGYTEEELRGVHYSTLIHPEDLDANLKEIQRLQAGELPFFEVENRYIHKNGQPVWVHKFVSVLTDARGEPAHLVALATDITARRQAEEALHQALAKAEEGDRLLSALMEYVPEGITIADSTGRVFMVSRRGQDLLGSPHAGKSVDEVAAALTVYHSDGVTPMDTGDLPLVRALRHGEVIHDAELIQINTRGEKLTLLCNAAPLKDADGSVVGGIVAWRDITARRQAEEALRMAKEEWERTFDAVPDFIAILDKDHHIVRVNKAMAGILANLPEEALGHPCYKAVHGLDEIPDFCPQAKMMATGQAASAVVEEFGLTLDVTVSPIFAPDGQLQGGVHIARDITEKKRAEKALAESEERYRSIFENSHASMLLIDPETSAIVDANPAASAYYGYSREEFLNHRITDTNTLDQEQVLKELQQARDEASRHFEFKHRLANGEIRDVEVFSGPIRVKGRELLYSIVHDITARKEAEEAVRESEARFRSLFEGMTEGVALHEIIYDDQGVARDYRILAINPAYTVHTGLTAEQVQGRLASEVYGLGEPPFLETYARVALIGQPETFEIYYPPLRRYFAVSATSPKPGHFVTVFEDITARQEMEEALRQAKDELEQRVEQRTAALRQTNELLLSEIEERQKMEDKLRDSEARFTAFMEHLPGLAMMRDMEGRYLFANRAWEENMNLKPGQWRDKTLAELWSPERSAFLQKSDFEIISTGEPSEEVEVHALADGLHHFLTNRFPIRDANGLPYMVGAIAIDVTGRQRAEQQVAETGRLYRVLSQVNEAIMRGRDQQSLFDQVCRIVVEEGLFRMAWVGLSDPENQTVRVAAKYGFHEGYLDNLAISLADVPESQGPTGTAVREDRYDVCNDFAAEPRMKPWRQQALERGYGSSGAFPLRVGNAVIGAITLYAPRPEFFTDKEIALLTSLADNLSFALEFLDRDTKRRQAEEALATERQRLFDLLENLPAFIYLQGPDYTLRFANREFRERFGEPDGGTCYTLLWGRNEPCPECPTFSVFHTGQPKEWEWTAPDSRIYQVYDYPFADVDGSPLVLEMGIDITSRKEAEEALAEQAMLVQDLYNNAPCGYHSLDSEGYFVQINDTELTWLGYNRDEVLGKLKFADLITPEGLKTFLETFPQLKTRGWVKDLEYELVRKDGTILPVLLNATAIMDEAGNYLMSRSTMFDIAERQRTEKALARSEAMLRLVLDTLPVGVWVTDREGRIIEGNPAARRIWEGARYVGMEEYGEYQGWWAGTGKKIEPDEWALARAIQKGETSTDEVINIQCFDGSRKTIINSGVPLFGENREILGAIVVNQDITEMLRAEEVIREQGRQLEAFFAHSLTPLVFLDPDFNFLRVNEAYARSCRREAPEFIGHSHFEFYPNAENEAIFAEVARSKTPYQVQAKPFEFPDHPEWGVTYWDWSLTPILNQAGEVDFLVFSLRDVTRRVMSEQARNRLIEILEATPDFVGIADFYGNLQYLNQAGRAMVGVGETEDVTSLKVLDLHPKEIGQLILERGVHRSIKEGAWQAELALLHRDGRIIPVSQVILAHKDAEGRVQFFSTVARDISDIKEARESILRQTAIVNGINRIFRETLTCETEAELGRTCLTVAEELTASRFGFIDDLNPQGTFDALAFSDPGWDQCSITSAKGTAHLKNIRPVGLLAKSVREGKAIIANEPASHPEAAGTPKGHPPLTAYLGLPLTYGDRTIGLIGLGNKDGGFTHADQEAVESLAPAIVEALMHHRAEEALKGSESKLRYLADQLLTAQENERKRLAAELHDELGHALLALKLHLSSIEKKLPPEQDDAKQAIRGQLDYIHEVIQDVRRLYHDLSPGDVEDLGITKALRTLVNDFAGHFPEITWEVDLADMEGLFSLPVQTTIYRILQEALTNIGKHANPNTVTISSTKENHQVRFIVGDDGAGFDVAQVLASRSSGRGVGLVAMEERLNMVGGTFEIQSRVNEGTRLSFTIPAIPEGERP